MNKYEPIIDKEEDCQKIAHIVTLANGEKVECDWSPYRKMTQEQVDKWVSLGCPSRIGIGPLSIKDLEKISLGQS